MFALDVVRIIRGHEAAIMNVRMDYEEALRTRSEMRVR